MNRIKQIQAHAFPITATTQTGLRQSPDLSNAGRLLDCSPPSTFQCNQLLRTYSASPATFHLCLSLFSSMRLCKARSPNLHSFTFAISACAASSCPTHGRALHGLLFKFGFELDAFVLTSLLHMYSKTSQLPSARKLFDEIPHRDTPIWNSMITGYARAGDLATARELFDEVPDKNVISWTSMISAYSQSERYEEAIEMFACMLETHEVTPNEVTLASVLPACANIGAIKLGEKIEAFARKNDLFRNVFVGSALVEMYAKCGEVDRAMAMFREVAGRRDVCAWNSMIMGLAVHGRWEESLHLFHEMKDKGLTPDEITFTGVLTACTHGGLVKEGKSLFKYMEKELFISPKIQHYGCMVDLLGRAGLVNEAYAVVKTMPMAADSVIWGALLGACSFHGNVELAETAMGPLLRLEPWNAGNYVTLANVYASAGRWSQVARVWKLMRGRQKKKDAGYSFIELAGRTHKFLAGDESHRRSADIYTLLDLMYAVMGLIVSDTNSRLEDGDSFL